MDISPAATATVLESYSPAASISHVMPGDRRAEDTIRVSTNGRLINEALKSANASPDLRHDKIAAIRERLANGSYEIDARRIARCLIREEPALFQI